jgi:hypothetical protein
MPIGITYAEVASAFDALQGIFESTRKEPFYSINLRKAFTEPFAPSTMANRRRQLSGLPLKLVDYKESDYIAVIILTGGSMVHPYTFKIKADGCFVYNIPFEYSKQSIGKWVKYISRWLNESDCYTVIRQQMRCSKIKRELIQRTLVNDD